MVYTISLGDPDYPALLAEIPHPPQTLYVRGQIPKNIPLIAVVGTRRSTRYGQQITEEIAADLARSGIGVVSGLALGIDGFAHTSALRVGGTTLAVLGSGVDEDSVYPVSHRKLAETIIKNGGALISEYPPGSKPAQYTFPARNRIIAGITLGTLVTEAPQESGALITAYHALEFNRDVFAVPHAATSTMGIGCNRLISQGATLTTHAAVIADTLHLLLSPKQYATPPLEPNQLILYEALSHEPQTIDELLIKTSLPSYQVLGILSILEMHGLIRCQAGRYIKNQ